MKHFLHNSLRALFLSLAVFLSLPVLAEKVEIDGINYELVAKIKEATVIKKSNGKYSGEVVIPESVEHEGTTYSVTSIGESAFVYSGLTSITIPNSVTDIEGYAFWDCYGLTSVHISDIAAWCNIEFGNYSSNPLCYAHHLYLNAEEVKDLEIPNSVTSIGNYAFSECSGLTSVTIPNSVTLIGEYAFADCSGLTSVTIPNSVESLGGWAFGYCSGLTSVTIGNSVTSIGVSAFCWCESLTSVTIPNSVTSIGNSAFGDCSGLTSVTIPNSVTFIGQYAFRGCSGLTSVTIPNSVTSIGDYAFGGCSGLTSVTIGNSVTIIGRSAFRECSGLTSVTIPNTVTSIGERAFSGCSGLQDVFCYAEKVPSANTDAFDGSYPGNATLHVPAASIENYKSTSPWRSFGNIVALTEEETGIDEVKGENANVKTAVYDISGRRVQKAQKGIFIQNGKVMVK